ncbi:hypothetical protein CBI36_08775 [Acetobacter oryzifermentans]|uniref:Uncharacterized protein n=2 Tax=Acetobacter TaxID=434 RepID=A0AAN1PHB0_9PROT|nr:hypothetical protein CBI36_08775 [Acetobacter oryzifermentans]AXN00155.1 hypothetical protein CJF59_06025 [Acetobacter pomorum]
MLQKADKFNSEIIEHSADGTAYVGVSLVKMRCELIETFLRETHGLFMARPIMVLNVFNIMKLATSNNIRKH